MNIDIHSHLLLQDTMGAAGRYGPSIEEEDDKSLTLVVGDYRCRSKPGVRFLEDPRFTDTAARLKDMDEKGIDAMGVTVSPLLYLYWAEPDIGIQFSQAQNDAMARFCHGAPGRLFFFATLPIQDLEASLEEIDRAASIGARGVNLGQSDVAIGRTLDDETLWPLYERMEALGLPLFIHPYPPGMETAEAAAMAAEDKYELSWMTGYVHQATVAGATLMFGGVFDVFPGLKVILSHGGGALPYQWGRLEFASRKVGAVRAAKPLDAYRENLYFDCLIHELSARRFLVEFAGADHVLVGDNYIGWDAVDGVEFVRELQLDPVDEAKILGGNAKALFRL
jgi:aminocarboxymuconate-semialdehyde decarboxylase